MAATEMETRLASNDPADLSILRTGQESAIISSKRLGSAYESAGIEISTERDFISGRIE